MNTTLRNPGPRPSNPADISFAPHCFAQDGVLVTFVVPAGNGSGSYPKHFYSEHEASLYAAKVGRSYYRDEAPRMVRIAWK